MGNGRRELPRKHCGGCSAIELGRHLEPAIGVEPTTRDNPQTSAHQNRSGQEGDCGIARSASITPPRNASRGGIEPPLPGPRELTIYGPLKLSRCCKAEPIPQSPHKGTISFCREHLQWRKPAFVCEENRYQEQHRGDDHVRPGVQGPLAGPSQLQPV